MLLAISPMLCIRLLLMQSNVEDRMPFVLGKSPKNPGKLPKENDVTALSEFQDMIWEAVPPRRHDNRKSYFAFVAEQLSWTPRRVRAFFHGEARTIRPKEWTSLNQRLDALKAAERRHEEDAHDLHQAYRDARESRALVGRNSIELGEAPAGNGTPGSPARSQAR
ncbi:MAG: hypothetical protein JSR91_00325 [Proteobacteria bacterium]|nr:hypothetical protein [Pseudomonadota bacterium]